MMQIQIPHNFTTREYQKALYNCIPQGFNRGLAVWHRRGGKDKVFMNILARESVTTVGTYFYILPYYKQARLVIWEGMDKDGFRFLHHIPPQLVKKSSDQMMTLELYNGSIIRFLGSDNIDSIVGANPRGVLFSEFSLQKIQAWDYLRPILIENKGWALFNGTPRGKNHMYKMWQEAQKDPTWFAQVLTIADTGVMTEEEVQREIAGGMPPQLAKQEFYCSWEGASVGSFYGDLMEESVFIGNVPYEPAFPVHVAWDLGINDTMVMIYFQILGREIRVIDCFDDNTVPLTHCVKTQFNSPYVLGYQALPHDIRVHELSTGESRFNQLHRLGLKNLRIMPKASLMEGIQATRNILPRCHFDATKCSRLIDALKDYRREFNRDSQTFHDRPIHNWASHYADAMRMLAISIKQSPELEERQLKAKHKFVFNASPQRFVKRKAGGLFA